MNFKDDNDPHLNLFEVRMLVQVFCYVPHMYVYIGMYFCMFV